MRNKYIKKEMAIAAILLCLFLAACAGNDEQPQNTVKRAEENISAGASEEDTDTGALGENEAAAVVSRDIKSSDDLPFPLGGEINSPSFTGTVYLDVMIPNDDVYHFPQTNHITFEPGARSSWHSHGVMIILATGGVGYYQEEGRPAQILRKGDVVECPAGVRHWHGAAADSWFSQMVIYDSHYSAEGAAAEEPVADVYYESMETEEYQGHTGNEENKFRC